jgi:hypothetical protein
MNSIGILEAVSCTPEIRFQEGGRSAYVLVSKGVCLVPEPLLI